MHFALRPSGSLTSWGEVASEVVRAKRGAQGLLQEGWASLRDFSSPCLGPLPETLLRQWIEVRKVKSASGRSAGVAGYRPRPQHWVESRLSLFQLGDESPAIQT